MEDFDEIIAETINLTACQSRAKTSLISKMKRLKPYFELAQIMINHGEFETFGTYGNMEYYKITHYKSEEITGLLDQIKENK